MTSYFTSQLSLHAYNKVISLVPCVSCFRYRIVIYDFGKDIFVVKFKFAKESEEKKKKIHHENTPI